MFNRPTGKRINPEATSIKPAMSKGVLPMISGKNCFGRQFARAQRIVDPLARERLDHPGGIAHQKKVVAARRQGRTGQRGNASPGVIRGNVECTLGPAPDRWEAVRAAHQTKVEQSIANWRLTRVSFGQELQHNPRAEIGRQWNVRLQGHAIWPFAEHQIAETRDSRIASIRRH
jgi:hypothetical protein